MKGLATLVSCPPLLGYLLLCMITVNGSPAPQAEEDAWLAVINSGTQQTQADAEPRQDTELYQFDQPEGLSGRVVPQSGERGALTPVDIVPQPYPVEQQPIDRFAQQSLGQQQQFQDQRVQRPLVPQQGQPPNEQRVPVPQQNQQRVPLPQRTPQRPQLPQQNQQRVPLPQQRLPGPRVPPLQQRLQQRPIRPGQQGPPRAGPRPGFPGNRRKPVGPPKKGLIESIGSTIGDAVKGISDGASCAATNVITDESLKNEEFIKFQLNCAMGRGQCDEIGKKIKILAPEVLAGRCPHPCDECTKKQIRKVMTELSQRFPREFQEMMTRLRG